MTPPLAAPRPATGVTPRTVPRPVAPRGRWERWFAVAVLVLATGSFFPLLGSTADPGSLPIARAIWAAGYVVAGLALFDGALRRRMPLHIPLTLLLLLLLTAVSVTWSVEPGLTLRRSVGLAGTLVVGMFLAQRLSPLEFLHALRRAMLIVAVCSLLLYAIGSPLALDEVHGTLRGVLSTKNTLGRMMSLGLLASTTAALLDGRQARVCTLSAIPMGVALALTDSTGGSLVAAAVIVCMIGALLWRARLGRLLLLTAVALALSVLAVVLPIANASSVTGVVGEDATLTGRTDIWELSLEAVRDRPLLGHGYEAFWQGSSDALIIQSQLNWPVPNAHNGLLDVTLGLGLVGSALAAIVLGCLLVQGLRDAAAGFTALAIVRLPIAGLLILTTVVESGLLQQNILLTVLLAAAFAFPRPDASGVAPDLLTPGAGLAAPQRTPHRGRLVPSRQLVREKEPS